MDNWVFGCKWIWGFFFFEFILNVFIFFVIFIIFFLFSFMSGFKIGRLLVVFIIIRLLRVWEVICFRELFVIIVFVLILWLILQVFFSISYLYRMQVYLIFLSFLSFLKVGMCFLEKFIMIGLLSFLQCFRILIIFEVFFFLMEFCLKWMGVIFMFFLSIR